jgi:LysR family transcriptional regulator, glycine cleavage system transcriptional activator
MTAGKFRLPPLEWVRAFEAAARCGSFTAAAEETGLTQSAISQRIGNLENLLGTALFHRRSRSIMLTVEGEAWLRHVRAALASLRDSSEALFGTGRGRLTISASQSIIELWLLPRLGQLLDMAPGQLSIQTMVLGAHEATQDDVIRIRYGAGSWPHEHAQQLFAEQTAPMASPRLATNNGPWTEWPRIACSGPRPGWNDWSRKFGTSTTPVPHLRFDTFVAALGAARTGLGVFLGSLPLCAEDLGAGRLVQLGDEVLHHHESYWVIAGPDAVARADWGKLSEALT